MLTRIDSFLGKIGGRFQDISWTVFRVLVAAMFMTHGFDKLFGENPQPFTGGGMTSLNIGELISIPMPLEINLLFIAGTIEFFVGFLILIGLWIHLVAAIAIVQMLMAYLIAHLAWFPTINNGELAAMYFLAYLILFAYGAGPYSLDTWLAKKRQQKGKKTADSEAKE